MTQQAVERALGKLLTDEKFRERVFVSPETACWEAALTLSATELEALSRCRGACFAAFTKTSTSGSFDPVSILTTARRER